MHTFLIAALTADGFIAKDADHLSTRWTSKEDAKFFNERTKQAGVCIMGSKTFDTINRPLPGRLTYVYTKNDLRYKIFDQRLVRATQLKPERLLEELAKEGYEEVAICGGSSIYTQFMEAGLIDTLYLTTEPVLFGTGMPLFTKNLEVKIELKEIHTLSEQTRVAEYQVVNG